jgi:hypothetical protein
VSTDEATLYQQTYGAHYFRRAPSGTGGSAISPDWVTVLTLGADSNATFTGQYLNINAGGSKMAIATNTDAMHFLADSNNNGTSNPFEWWVDSPTIDGGTKLSSLSNSGDLWLKNDLTVAGGVGTGTLTTTGNATFAGNVKASGSVSSPNFAFGEDNDCGIYYNHSTQKFAIAIDGARAMYFTNTGGAVFGTTLSCGTTLTLAGTTISYGYLLYSTTKWLLRDAGTMGTYEGALTLKSSFTVGGNYDLDLSASGTGNINLNNNATFAGAVGINGSAQTYAKTYIKANDDDYGIYIDKLGAGDSNKNAIFISATNDATALVTTTNSGRLFMQSTYWNGSSRSTRYWGIQVIQPAATAYASRLDFTDDHGETPLTLATLSGGNTGAVGINQTAPTYELDVTGGARITGAITSGAISGTSGTFSGNVEVSKSSQPHLQIQQTSGNAWRWYTSGTDSFIRNATGGHNILSLEADGDIGFYNSDGSATPFFWDASALSLGIGTTSPDDKLHVQSGTNGKHVFGQGYTHTRAEPASIALQRIGGNLSSPAIIASNGAGSGTLLGNIGADAYSSGGSGASFHRACGIKFVTDQNFTTNDAPGAITFYTRADYATGDEEQMRISSSGNVGVGNTSPEEKLHITDGKLKIDRSSGAGTGDVEIHFDRKHDAADARIICKGGASGAYGTELHFVTTLAGSPATENTVMVLDDNARVGIGTTTPQGMLEISDDSGPYNANHVDKNANLFLTNNQDTDGEGVGITFHLHDTLPKNKGCAIVAERQNSDASDLIFKTTRASVTYESLKLSNAQALFTGDVQADGFKSSDGSAGITTTKTWEDGSADTHTVTIKDGLITAWTIVT